MKTPFDFALLCSIVLVGSAVAGAAEAAPITTLFSTGVDAGGAPLADGVADSHYTVLPGPTAFTIEDLSAVDWIANTASSSWISPALDTRAGSGPFTYQTTFDLSGFNPATAFLSGQISADNQATIFLNGVDVFHGESFTLEPWTFLEAFSITSGFIAGVNALTILVSNADVGANDGPTGLHLNISGSATAAAISLPEPPSLLLLVPALLALRSTRRRKARQAAAMIP